MKNTEKIKHIIGLLTGFFGCMLGTYVVILFNGNILMSLPLAVRMIAMIAVYWLIAAVPIVVMILSKDKLTDCGFSREKIVKQIIVGIAAGIAMSLVVTIVPYLAGFGELISSGKPYTHLWQFAYEFVYCIFAVGLTEEFVFRGFLYHKLQSAFGSELAAIIGSSVLFGLFHIFNESVLQIIMTALIGAIFCLCRKFIKNCTTLSLIIAHGVYDALITVWNFVFT
jgi:hypothetical protein